MNGGDHVGAVFTVYTRATVITDRIETTEDEVRGTATGAAVASVETDGATTPLYLGYIDGMIHYRYVVVVNRTGRPTVNGMASTSQSVRP